jgi:hypothetical protein
MTRQQQQSVEELQKNPTPESLWQAVVAFQGEPFHTMSGLPFSYAVKRKRNGEYSRELLVDRRQESKTLTWSSFALAFENAGKMRGTVIARPKALGDIRGISYIYPMLYRFGLIEVPEDVAGKLECPVAPEGKSGQSPDNAAH